MGRKVCLRCKGKTLQGVVNELLKTKDLLTSPSNVLPLYLKQTFPPIIWIFTEGDWIESRLPFKIFSTLPCSWCCYHLATWSSHILLRRSQFSHWFVKSTARWRACRIEIIQTGHTPMSWQSPCRSTLTFTTIYCSVSNCSIVNSVVLNSSISIIVINCRGRWGRSGSAGGSCNWRNFMPTSTFVTQFSFWSTVTPHFDNSDSWNKSETNQ